MTKMKKKAKKQFHIITLRLLLKIQFHKPIKKNI